MSLRDDYRRDGYVVLPSAVTDLLPPPEIVGWVEKTLRILHAESPDAYRAQARLMSKFESVMSAFLAPSIKNTCRDLGIKMPIFTTAPANHIMGIDPNWEGVAAHQDWPAIQTSLNTVVIWIPYHDVSQDNFPLEIVKGSHLQGLLPSKAGDHYSSVDTEGMEFTPVPVNRGDVILFSAFAVHRTRTPGSGFRCAFSFRYEDGADPWFRNHNHYAAQSRVIDREIKWAPTTAQILDAMK